jgi:Rrf2 family protein
MAPHAKRSENRRKSVALCGWLEVTVGAGGVWSVSRKQVLDQAPRGRLLSRGVFVHSPASMRFSLQVQYAICGSFDLAYNGGGNPVQIRVISERQAIPVRYLEQIFQRLRREGLIDSKRGPGGGYTLARAPEEITLREIIEALEGPLSENLEMSPPDDPSKGEFRPNFVWDAVAERLGDALSEITLGALCKQAVRANLRGTDPDAPMYFI